LVNKDSLEQMICLSTRLVLWSTSNIKMSFPRTKDVNRIRIEKKRDKIGVGVSNCSLETRRVQILSHDLRTLIIGVGSKMQKSTFFFEDQ